MDEETHATANDVLDYALEHSTAGQDTICLHGRNQLLVLTVSPHLPLSPSRDLHRGTAVCVHSDGDNPAVSVSAEP